MRNNKETINSLQSASYKGKLARNQTTVNSYRGTTYQPITYNSLNSLQNHLYHRALSGLNVYSKEEIMTMNKEKRRRIIKVHKKAKKVINLLKQEAMTTLSNKLLTSMFPKSPIAKKMLDVNENDSEFVCKLSLKDLAISKKNVIDRLMADGILPNNFYYLK